MKIKNLVIIFIIINLIPSILYYWNNFLIQNWYLNLSTKINNFLSYITNNSTINYQKIIIEYKNKNYTEVEKLLKETSLDKASLLYNLWNINYKIWENSLKIKNKIDYYKKSIQYYKKSLKNKSDKKTLENKEFVEEKLKQLEEEQKEQEKNNENKNQENESLDENNDSDKKNQEDWNQNDSEEDSSNENMEKKSSNIWFNSSQIKDLQKELSDIEKKILKEYIQKLQNEEKYNLELNNKNKKESIFDILERDFSQNPNNNINNW